MIRRNCLGLLSREEVGTSRLLEVIAVPKPDTRFGAVCSESPDSGPVRQAGRVFRTQAHRITSTTRNFGSKSPARVYFIRKQRPESILDMEEKAQLQAKSSFRRKGERTFNVHCCHSRRCNDTPLDIAAAVWGADTVQYCMQQPKVLNLS